MMTATDIKTDPIPLVEESAHIEKRVVEGDRVSVSTTTTEETEWVRERLNCETVDISRVAIGQDVSSIPSVRHEDGVTIIPVVRERLIVIKQLHLVEEIHVGKKQTSTEICEPVVVRRMEAAIERTPADQETE